MKMWIMLVATVWAASAQDLPDFSRPVPAVPQAPVRWVEEYSYPPVAGSVERRNFRVTVEHTKNATRVVENLGNGPAVEHWYFQGFEIRKIPEVGEFVVVSPAEALESRSADYARVFFPRLTWIGEKTFKGKEKKDGKETFVFEAPYGTASTQRAYLSAETLLPVAFDSPSFTIRYSFSPAEPVELPADFKEALEKYRSQVRAALKPVGGN